MKILEHTLIHSYERQFDPFANKIHVICSAYNCLFKQLTPGGPAWRLLGQAGAPGPACRGRPQYRAAASEFLPFLPSDLPFSWCPWPSLGRWVPASLPQLSLSITSYVRRAYGVRKIHACIDLCVYVRVCVFIYKHGFILSHLNF